MPGGLWALNPGKRLECLRVQCAREASKERRADYGAMIDRLHALAYWLTEPQPHDRAAETACSCAGRIGSKGCRQVSAGRSAAWAGNVRAPQTPPALRPRSLGVSCVHDVWG